MNWKGIFCPIVTPFNHLQDLYPAKIQHNLSRLDQIDLAGYIVGSATGESEMLSFEERIALLELAAQSTAKPKIVATREPGVREAARVITKAAELGYQAAILETGDEFFRGCVEDRVPIPVLAEKLDAPPIANAVPYVYQTIFEAERSREAEAAADWRARLQPAQAAIDRYGIPGLKAVMDRFGYYGGPPRLPRVALTPAQADEVAAAFDGLRS